MGRITRGCLAKLASLASLLAVLFSGQLGCVGIALGVVILYFIVIASIKTVSFVVLLVKILLLIGILFGLAITIRNYVMALYHNVKPEKVTP